MAGMGLTVGSHKDCCINTLSTCGSEKKINPCYANYLEEKTVLKLSSWSTLVQSTK